MLEHRLKSYHSQCVSIRQPGVKSVPFLGQLIFYAKPNLDFIIWHTLQLLHNPVHKYTKYIHSTSTSVESVALKQSSTKLSVVMFSPNDTYRSCKDSDHYLCANLHSVYHIPWQYIGHQLHVSIAHGWCITKTHLIHSLIEVGADRFWQLVQSISVLTKIEMGSGVMLQSLEQTLFFKIQTQYANISNCFNSNFT